MTEAVVIKSIHYHLVQANQQVQQAWAQVKSKEPLNKRASLLASSASNAQSQVQRQPTHGATTEQPQRSQPADKPETQQSRSNSRENLQPSTKGNAAERQSAFAQESGSFTGGSHNAEQMAAALRGAVPGATSLQVPYPGQGESARIWDHL